MHSSAALAACAAALAACASTDVSRPIGLIVDGLTEPDAVELAEAARCWNLRFGTQLVTGPEGSTLDQQIEVFYDDFTCIRSYAQYQPGTPGAIAMCPERYRDPARYGLPIHITPFRILSHELGHALNIVGHPSKNDLSGPVMLTGGPDFSAMFTKIDAAMFADANPDFTPPPRCPRVIRLALPGISGPIGHCTCDAGTLDISQPIAIVPYPGAEQFPRQELTAAAGCWNLRYGTHLVVPQSPAPPDPALQLAYLAPPELDCFNPRDFPGRHLDGRAVSVCGQGHPLQDIGTILGVPYSEQSGPAPFLAADDDAFARVYPDRQIACHDLRIDQQSGACTCVDPPSVYSNDP